MPAALQHEKRVQTTHWWLHFPLIERKHDTGTSPEKNNAIHNSSLYTCYKKVIKTNFMLAWESLVRKFENLKVWRPCSLLDKQDCYVGCSGWLLVCCYIVASIDMYRCPIRPLQIRWRIRHFGTVNLTSFTIIINEYSKIYRYISEN